MKTTKLALVLSGGGMGGAAHLGAIKAIEEYNLKPEAVLGTSIGAFVGSVYASGATPQMMIDGWQKISQMDPSEIIDLDFKSFRHAVSNFDYRPVTGFLLGRVLMQMLTDNYIHIRSFPELARLSATEREAKNIKELYISSTSILDGRETIFCDTQHIKLDANGLYEDRRFCHHVSFVEAVRASFSLPAVFIPQEIPFPDIDCPCKLGVAPNYPNHHLYVDGSIKDDYPITIAAKIAKADKIIGINLTKAGSKANFFLQGGLPEVQSRVVKIIGDDQYEADQYDKDVAKADLITLDPAIGDVGVFEMRLGDWLIERGYQTVKQCFTEKGLDPSFSREQNLEKLFPPKWVDHCPDCGQALATPRDLGTHELFIANLPPYTPPDVEPTAKKSFFKAPLAILRRWQWPIALMGLFILFALGGFQFWWFYKLANGSGQGVLVFMGGGLIYLITVLIGAFFIGWWLVLLLKALINNLRMKE